MQTSIYTTKTLPSAPAEDKWPIGSMLAILTEMGTHTARMWRHLGRVARYAVALGREAGLGNEALMSVQCAAILHDVGKRAIPPELLNKISPLERDEWYSITKHAMASSKILRESALPIGVISAAQAHHERYDGTGYPLGLAGEVIPVTARVLSIADAYDAMSSDRPYRPAFRPHEVMAEIEKGAGKQFDPTLVRKVWPLIESGIVGNLPAMRMRVVSDDPMLYRQLWFAAHPHGWEIEAWPAAWAGFCPPELLPENAEKEEKIRDEARMPGCQITVVDGRCARRLPDGARMHLPKDALWIDPPGRTRRAIRTPLDLRDVLGSLYETGKEAWSRPPTARIKVVIADPYHLFRQMLRRCLDERDDVVVVAEVSSPSAYRRAVAQHKFDVAIVASDLLMGTHTTAPLQVGDAHLEQNEITAGQLRQVPTIVLVADEDVADYDVALYDAPLAGDTHEATANCVYVHRGAPAERLVEAMKSMVGTTDDRR
ncbi:MAG TPA: HD domain-containing phosphohydrolase [Chloroflexia bacterium]|nr:HD domain-containing phosphohydrolase [Chloroflexia bacterium]